MAATLFSPFSVVCTMIDADPWHDVRPFEFTDEGIVTDVFWHGGLRFDELRADPGPSLAHYLSACDSAAATYAEQYAEDAAEIKPYELRCRRLLDLTTTAAFEEWMGDLGGSYSSEWGRRAQCANQNFDLRSGGAAIGRAWGQGYDAVAFWDSNAYNRGATLSVAIRSGHQARLAPVPALCESMIRGYRVRGADTPAQQLDRPSSPAMRL